MHSIHHSQSDYLIEVNVIGALYPYEKVDSSGIQMGPRQMKVLELDVWPWYVADIQLSFSLGWYTTVFQAEVPAIKACADENNKRGYCNRNIYILSDSQAAIKALGNCKMCSKLA
jgi:hypothetical protein